MPNRLTPYKFRLHMPQHMTLPSKWHHSQGGLERRPSKLAMLVIYDDGRISIHEADKNR